MIKRLILGAALGAAVGIVLHLLLREPLGGACLILCRPERAAIAGAILGAVAAAVPGKEKAEAQESDEEAS